MAYDKVWVTLCGNILEEIRHSGTSVWCGDAGEGGAGSASATSLLVTVAEGASGNGGGGYISQHGGVLSFFLSRANLFFGRVDGKNKEESKIVNVS